MDISSLLPAKMAVALKKMQLTIEPNDKVRFVGDTKGEIHTSLRITNKSETKQAYKVKCTRNDLFRIRPATGILDYNQSIVVNLIYKHAGGEEKPDEEKLHFGIYHIPAPEGCSCEGAWAEHYGPAQGEMRLRVGFDK